MGIGINLIEQAPVVLHRLNKAPLGLQCAPQLGVLAQQALLCAAAGGARVSPCIPAACTAIIVQTQARALCSNVQDTCKACWRPAGSEEQDIVRALRTKRAAQERVQQVMVCALEGVIACLLARRGVEREMHRHPLGQGRLQRQLEG